MPSHAEERCDCAEEQVEEGSCTPECAPRLFQRLESVSSDSSSSSSSSVYPGSIPEIGPRDSRLKLTSALHRMLTYPLGISKKLRLNVEALAAVGFFWSSADRLQCFSCGHVELSVTPWQDLNFKQVQLRHYECTHPTDDDIPPSRAATCLNYEAHRLFTFYNDNWECSFMDAGKLAESGFYYTGKADICKCHFCNLEMSNWEAGDTPDGEHKKWNQTCPFLNNKPVGNFKLGDELHRAETGTMLYEIRPFARAENDHSRFRILPDVVPKLGRLQDRPPVHAEMATVEARLASFDKWPKEKPQLPSDLAEAGFFHTGKDDEVLCFHCDGGLKEWAAGDEPWVLHAKWFSVCAFLQRKMGKSFITSVQRVHKPVMSLKDFKAAIEETEKSILDRTTATLDKNFQHLCKTH